MKNSLNNGQKILAGFMVIASLMVPVSGMKRKANDENEQQNKKMRSSLSYEEKKIKLEKKLIEQTNKMLKQLAETENDNQIKHANLTEKLIKHIQELYVWDYPTIVDTMLKDKTFQLALKNRVKAMLKELGEFADEENGDDEKLFTHMEMLVDTLKKLCRGKQYKLVDIILEDKIYQQVFKQYLYAKSKQLESFEMCSYCKVRALDIDSINLHPSSKTDHIFHEKCLKSWFVKNKHCPLCNKPDLTLPTIASQFSVEKIIKLLKDHLGAELTTYIISGLENDHVTLENAIKLGNYYLFDLFFTSSDESSLTKACISIIKNKQTKFYKFFDLIAEIIIDSNSAATIIIESLVTDNPEIMEPINRLFAKKITTSYDARNIIIASIQTGNLERVKTMLKLFDDMIGNTSWTFKIEADMLIPLKEHDGCADLQNRPDAFYILEAAIKQKDSQIAQEIGTALQYKIKGSYTAFYLIAMAITFGNFEVAKTITDIFNQHIFLSNHNEYEVVANYYKIKKIREDEDYKFTVEHSSSYAASIIIQVAITNKNIDIIKFMLQKFYGLLKNRSVIIQDALEDAKKTKNKEIIELVNNYYDTLQKN